MPVNRRWRPSLALVLGGGLLGTLVISFAGLVALRYLGPEIGFRNAAALLALAITLATAVPGWLLLRLLMQPIQALEVYATAHERGENPARPLHFGTLELHATAQSVFAMAEALRDREAALRAFTDHVVHEVRTPVSAVRAACELLEDGQALSTEDARLVAGIDSARAQIEAQLAALQDMVRARETRYLGASSLAEVLPQLRADCPELELRIMGETLHLPMAEQGLAVILGQMLRNASEHGATSVSLRAILDADRPCLEVSDNGAGVSGGNAARIFNPFFTTRREVGGTGMGLAVVRNLLQSHGATIALIPSTTGARFQISFAAIGSR